MTPIDILTRLDTRICEHARVWAVRLTPLTTPAAAWETCPRVTWLLWFAGFIAVPFEVLLGTCLEIGRLAVGVEDLDPRPRRVLDATAAWLAASGPEALAVIEASVVEGVAFVTSATEVHKPSLAQIAAIYAAHTAIACGKLALVGADPACDPVQRAVHADAVGYYATRAVRPDVKGEERRGGIPSAEQLSEPHRDLSELVRRAMPWSLVREAIIRRWS